MPRMFRAYFQRWDRFRKFGSLRFASRVTTKQTRGSTEKRPNKFNCENAEPSITAEARNRRHLNK